VSFSGAETAARREDAAWYARALNLASQAIRSPAVAGTPAPLARGYRPDIDGLRAVAVTMVIGYHLLPKAVPAGFIGVDIFFVISGYLITQLILGGIGNGSFSIWEFYRRRVRRIVPALLVVLAACLLFAWFVLLPSEFRWFGRSVTWSAPFLANVHFARVTGYFDPGADYNLLLHLWSLGVEEQFYLLWPLLLVLAVRQRVTTAVLAAVIGTSFLIGVWGARSAPVPHFFLPGPRAWQLAAGALLAAWPLGSRALPAGGTGRVYRLPLPQLLSVAGLVLLAAGAEFLSADHAFPGVWGLIPVAGALCLIGAGPLGIVNRALLGSAPLVTIGRMSYSLYLWHWPVFAFGRALWGPTLPLAALAGIAVLTVIAAGASYLWIERPARRGAGRWAVPALLAGLIAFTALGAAVSEGRIGNRLSGPAFTAWEAAVTDWHIPDESRPDPPAKLRVPALSSGHAATVLFIGDSHMQQYWPHIAQLVATHPERTRSVLFAAYAGCPMLPSLNSLRQPRSCDAFFDAAVRQAFQPQVDTVVFGAFWELYLLGEFGQDDHQGVYSVHDPLRRQLRLESPATQRALEELEQLLARLTASGRRVFIVLSNPTSPEFDPRWLVPWQVRLSPTVPVSFGLDPERRVDAREFEAFVAPLMDQLRAIAARTGATVLDPRSTLCDGMSCPAVAADGTPLYIDSNHLRAAYARERAGFLDPAVLLDSPQ
jgi:peptidoglycan/LPS O-acetylase OafA/YrhL